MKHIIKNEITGKNQNLRGEILLISVMVMSSDKWGFIAHPIYYNLTLYLTTVGVRAL